MKEARQRIDNTYKKQYGNKVLIKNHSSHVK